MKLEKGQLVVDLHEYFDGLLSGPDREEALESLACHPEVLKHVTAQLLDRWTENGWHGATTGAAPAECFTPLDKARRRLAEGANDFRGTYCKELVKELDKLKEELRKTTEELDKLKYPRQHNG